MNEDIYRLAARWILKSKHTVIFSGAGISVESGIPPFRGKNGLWNKYDPIFLHKNYFKAHPKESWVLIKEIFYDFFGQANPNEAHYIIAELEKKKIIKAIITQNIDNLHQKAGSQNVIEFHGTAQILTCMECKKKINYGIHLNDLPPHCPKCGGLLKPDFVFFGEPIPSSAYNESIKNAELADLFILVGTTGEIMPASAIPYIAKKNGAKFIEVNIKPSKYTHTIVDIFLKGKATEIFLKLKELLP
ncbi:MAG: NAD-dependent protein deacylase [Promethearchaeota archaeon]